jgi:hypothetical protein
MTAVLGHNTYGKANVNVLKVERGADRHHIWEVCLDRVAVRI